MELGSAFPGPESAAGTRWMTICPVNAGTAKAATAASSTAAPASAADTVQRQARREAGFLTRGASRAHAAGRGATVLSSAFSRLENAVVSSSRYDTLTSN